MDAGLSTSCRPGPSGSETSGTHCVGAAELEAQAQRRNFVLALVGTLATASVFGIGFALQGQWREVLIDGVLIAACTACGLFGRCTGRLREATAGLAMVVIVLVAWQMVAQGPALPAAATWLAVLPFVPACSGLHAMAVVAVVVYVSIVGLLLFVPEVSAFGGVPVEVDAPRRFAAHLGSQSLAIALVVAAMAGRRKTARAVEEARKAAIQALTVRSRFLANMSHEIRTPLNGIIGTAELMCSPSLDDSQRARLQHLQHQSAQQLLALVNDVLDWSKLDAGKVTFETRPVSLRHLVFEANERFAIQAHHKGIELTSSCNPDVPAQVLADETRLRQILDNLVSNAVKFTARGGVHIHLSVDSEAPRCEQPTPRWVRMEVADSGIGIEPHRLRSLFDAFTQADDSVTRRFGGTGLGLAICRELARMMGGRIDVTTAPGQGSTFALVLPLLPVGSTREFVQCRTSAGVIVASASAGVQRHLGTILNDLGVESQPMDTLPPTGAARDGRIVLVDAPLLAAQPEGSKWLQRQADAGRQVVLITPLGAEPPSGLPPSVLQLHKPVRRRALRAVLERARTHSPEPTPSAQETDPAGHGPLHVLVAEDNLVNQIVVQEMLSRLGARCTLVGDGHEALERLAAERFDLVLMDLQMPRLGGAEATRALRAAEVERGVPHVPMVAMTAHSHAEEMEATQQAGMDDWLTKPFPMAELRRVLREWGAATTDGHGRGSRHCPT